MSFLITRISNNYVEHISTDNFKTFIKSDISDFVKGRITYIITMSSAEMKIGIEQVEELPVFRRGLYEVMLNETCRCRTYKKTLSQALWRVLNDFYRIISEYKFDVNSELHGEYWYVMNESYIIKVVAYEI